MHQPGEMDPYHSRAYGQGVEGHQPGDDFSKHFMPKCDIEGGGLEALHFREKDGHSSLLCCVTPPQLRHELTKRLEEGATRIEGHVSHPRSPIFCPTSPPAKRLISHASPCPTQVAELARAEREVRSSGIKELSRELQELYQLYVSEVVVEKGQGWRRAPTGLWRSQTI